MKNILSIILIGMVAIGLSSCATNKPLALNSININKSMQVEPLDELIKQFSKTNNSLIPKSQFNKELSPSNIAELAVILNPNLKIDRYDLNLAEVNLEQSKLLPNPQISFSISKPISGTLTNPYIAYGISPSFDIGSIIQRNTKVKIAQLEFESKKLQLKWDEWQTYEYAKLFALNFIILSNKLDLYRKIEHLEQEKYNHIYKAYKEGLIDQSVILNVQSQLQQSELEVQANEKLLNDSKSAIYQLLGLPYNYTLPINTRLKFKPLQNFKEEAQLLNNV
ncbi:MAG: TolC family protein, partial [Desulfurella sp.]